MIGVVAWKKKNLSVYLAVLTFTKDQLVLTC